MATEELERIVKEYCEDLEKKLMKNLRHFHDDWDGRHIRALARIIQNYEHDSVKKARRQIERSMTYYAMSL